MPPISTEDAAFVWSEGSKHRGGGCGAKEAAAVAPRVPRPVLGSQWEQVRAAAF